MSAELRAEPIVAWRVWRVIPRAHLITEPQTVKMLAEAWDRGENPFRLWEQPALVGIGVRTSWPPGDNTAECTQQKGHQAPERDCDCGFWAVKTELEAIETMSQYASGSSLDPYRWDEWAWGEVELWGRVYEHTEGWRAQHAKPLRIWLAGGTDDEARALGEAYDCEVLTKTYEPTEDTDTVNLISGVPLRISPASFPSFTAHRGGITIAPSTGGIVTGPTTVTWSSTGTSAGAPALVAASMQALTAIHLEEVRRPYRLRWLVWFSWLIFFFAVLNLVRVLIF